MGLFDLFKSLNMEKMLDELIRVSSEICNELNADRLINYLIDNKIQVYKSPTSLSWFLDIENVIWQFSVHLDENEKTINVLYVKNYIPIGKEEISKFGSCSFYVRNKEYFFTIKSLYVNVPIPQKGIELAEIIKKRGYHIRKM